MQPTFVSGDVPRVNGQLAVARAFGDQSLKAHLSSEPDIRHVPIDSTIQFVILASDGLWKVSCYASLFLFCVFLLEPSLFLWMCQPLNSSTYCSTYLLLVCRTHL